MIHYTLLPENEIKALKKEYRTRLTVFQLFFMSCAVLIGTGSLLPAYIFSYNQEKSALDQLSSFQKSRQERGMDSVMSDFKITNDAIALIDMSKESIGYSNIISNIIRQKPYGLTIKSFSLGETNATATSSITAVIQGKSNTREELIKFRDSLELDPRVLKVELPVSDLAKNKNISYSIKIVISRTI